MANRCTTIEEALERIYNIIDSAQNKDNPVQYVLDGFKEVAEVVPLDLYPEIIKFIKEAKEDGSFAVIDQINEESCFTENADFDRIRADIEEKARNLSQYEETVVRKSQVKQQLLKGLFGENLYTAQYYLRSAKNGFGLVQGSSGTGIPGLIDTFLANRKNQKLVRNQDIAENVRNTKQALLDKVLEFMRNQKERNSGYINRGIFSKENTRLFDRNGEYLNTLDPETELYNVITSWFNPKNIAMSNSLDTKYTLFKIENNPEAREYIDAYTAWTLLTNFDTTLILTLGNSVLITEPSNFNKISNVSYKTNIDKATNMWSFGFGDDVEDVGDLISDITKLLVESSKRYSWKVNVPNQDSYLSFKDFNYIIGKVKNLAFTLRGKSDIDLEYYINGKNIITNENVYNLSGTTRGVYENFKEFNKSIGKEDEPVTLGQLIAFASENPMRSLHAIFDILCNTDILTTRIKSFTDTDKNLLWSCYKEIFGQCGENSRSLFDLHHNTEGDTIFSIIAQLADSMFQEDIIQYYEDDNKTLYAQLMRDYTINQIRNELAQQIQQSSSATLSKGTKEFTDAYNVKIEFTNKGQLTTTDKQAWEVGTVKETVPVQAKLIAEIKIPVKITRNGKKIEAGEIIATATNIKFESKNNITEEEIWNSGDFRELIKDATGINFGADPDFAQAYQQMFQGASEINYTALLDDITRIVGRSIFNNYFNTKLVPQILHEFSLTWNQPNINNIAYSQFMNVESIPRVDPKTGLIPSIPSADKNLVLDKLSKAKAISNNIYTSAQVKTGEGTALAAYCLSRLRNSYQYQLVTQNRAAWSASKDMTFVDNKNGLFNKVFTSREIKLSATVKPSTKMSSVELWSLNFYNDWVSAFVKKTRTNSPNGDGACCFIPSVNSDKGQYDKLGCNLNALSHIKDIKGNPIAYRNLTSDQIVNEICMEFGPFYKNVINNITKEWDRVLSVILSNELLETDASGNKTAQTKIYEDAIADINQISNPVVKWREQLKFINKYFSGKKEKTLDGLYRITTKYNMTHTRNPIQLAEQIHYTKGDDGLSVNKVLVAQWARFGGAATEEDLKQANFTKPYYRESLDQAKITQLYYRESLDQDLLDLLKKTVSAEDLSKETISAATLSKELFDKIPDDNPLKEEVRAARRASVQSTAKGFFRMRDFESVIKLLKNGCKIYLYGAKAREQAETEFLRNFGKTSKDKKSPWVTDSGMMAFVRVTGEDGKEYPTNNFNDLIEAQNSGRNWEVHPLISKLNRMHYLTTQQYTCCVGGAVYAYKGKSGSNVLEEEANRWLASNKRNVCYTATIHKFLNKLLNGSPTTYNYAIFDDIDAALYNVMGELNVHTPLDGGMLVNSFLPDLENASLGGEAAGTDKKHFGTFYLEKYGAGGITKTAGFAATNERMRNSEAWRIVQYNMSHRKWVKEFGNADGDIPETELNITKDYDGNDINWPDKKIFYYRELKDGTIKFYRLSSIEKTNNINEYEIYEVPVDESGGDIGQPELREITVIDNNWDLFTKVFGGYRSLGREVSSTGVENPNSRLTYSERSRKLMVEAINRIGYRKVSARKYSMIDKLGNKAEAYTKAATREDRHEDDQDDVWQPLKYSDIHFMPNIGAIKSAQMNVNPPEVLSQKMDLNVMPVERPKLGIQLDKEHSADDAELSMPTQIITACANKGYTLTKTTDMYRAISTLTELAIEDCMEGIMDLVPGGENRGLLKAQIAQIIVDKLIQSKDDNEALHAVLGFLEDKVKAGGKVSPEDVQNIPWSDTLIYNKLYSDIASHLTSQAIKLKLSGSMAVICPTHYLERFYGNKRLAALFDLIPGGIGEKAALVEYQRKIREENYEGGLIYDRDRDSGNSEIELLNQASKINTQHIYHLEYINPLTGEVDPNPKQITINYPMQYYQLRDEIVKFRQASQEELKGALAVTRADGTILVSRLEDIDPEAFYAYINGEAKDAEGKVIVSSEQKRKVFELLKESGYTIDSLKTLLGNDPRKILAFLKFHELSHKKYKDNITINTERNTKQSSQTTQFTWNRTSDNSYEVSSKGDKRFSALYAAFKKGTVIDGVDVGGMTIEDVYQKVVKKSDKGKAPSRDSRLFIDTTPKLRGKMSFAFGSQRADGVTADTTLEAIKRGERTATTRYTSDGNINYWKQAKVGDVIEFSGQNGEKVLVRVTKELHQLPKSTTAEEWSSKEGWDTSRFEQRVKPQIDKGEAYQMEFEYIDPSKEAMEDFSYREGYLPLWQEWARQNPKLMEELRENAKGKTLTDRFANTRVSQARALADILNSQRVKEQKGDILSNAVIEMEARATKEAWDKMIEIEAESDNAQKYLQEISELNAVYEAVCKQEQKEDGTTEIIPLGRELSAYNARFKANQNIKSPFGKYDKEIIDLAEAEDLQLESNNDTGIEISTLLNDDQTVNWEQFIQNQRQYFEKLPNERFTKGRYDLSTRPEKHGGTDKFTLDHTQRVVESSAYINNLPESLKQSLLYATLLHDIGKPFRNEDHGLDSIIVANELFKSFPNEKLVKLAVRYHMVQADSSLETLSDILKTVEKYGVDQQQFVDLLLALKTCDIINGRSGSTIDQYTGKTVKETVQSEISTLRKRFSDIISYKENTKNQREFCIYDLDSIKLLFEVINDTKPKKGYKLDEIKGYFKNQLTTLAGIQNYIQSNPLLQNNYAQIIENMLKYIETKYNNEFNTFKDVHGNYTFLQTLTDGDPTAAFTDHPELLNKAIEAYKHAIKLFLRKQLQKDLINLSLDYKGKRNVMIGGKVYNIDGDSITPIAYELIMPKIYKTVFGLQENDDLQRISADKNFFARRGISRLKNQIGDDSLYDYQLKRFTGDHMYIFDANHGSIPKGLIPSPNFHLFTEQDGSYSRVDVEGNVIYPLSSKDDEVMMTADGVEVIITKNPAFFIENNNSNAITFSNSRVNEERMQDIVDKLKNSTTNNGRRFIRTFTDRNGKIKNFSTLKKRNRMFADLKESILESNESTGNADLDRLVAEISQEGLKVHASFLKSLEVIAGRIPAQSQQSFMTQKVAAFTNSDINSAYVSTFQLFIQGSDLDIDTVNLIGAGFDRQGHYVLWSPYANLGNSELIKASEQLPFPTGQATEITYDNSKDSFFITFNDFFGKDKLFNIELDPNTYDAVRNEQGVYKISFDSESPKAIKQLAEFLNLVEKVGLNLKGNVDQYGNHQYSRELDEEIYAQNLKYRDLGIFTDLHIRPSQLLNVLQQIKEIVDKHNLYIKKVDKRTKEIMAKNLSYCRMFEIAGDPANQMEAQDSIDNSTKVIKGPEGAVKVTMTEEDKNQVSSNNETKSFPDPVSMVDSLQTNQVGKYDVSVAAKAVQACSMIQYAYDSLLNSDAPEEKKRRLELPNGGYKIAGKQWTAIANLHDKTHEETGEMQQPGFIQDMLKVLDDETVEKINSAIQNAAMLSVAVDNAKDLSLGKINAGPAMLGMYAYGITLGIDVVTLAKIINSPQGRAISKALSGNVFTGDMGFSSALQAINFLNGQNLTRFLTQFDYADNRGSKTLFNAFRNIAAKKLSRDQKDECAQEIQERTTKSITKVVEILLRKGQFDSYLNQIQKTSSWGYSEKQLFEALKEYNALIQLWHGDENKKDENKKHDLEILSQGAEEIRVLGVLLGSNKGVKTKIEDGINFINTLENIISDRYKIMHPDADESKLASLKIDYLRFCTDKEYMERCIDEYDKVKHTVNILQVVALCPHIFSYLRASIIPHAGFMSASSKYRSTQAVINSGIYNILGIRAAKDKSNSLKGLNNEINAMMLMQWLSDTKKVFYLPSGQRYFKSGTNELVVYEGKDPLPISLWTPEGLATFKLYMEQCILPELQRNSAFEDNKFVKNLSPFTLSQTGTRATVSAYTLTGNLLPKAGTAEEALLREYQAAFEAIRNTSFPYKEYKKDTSEGSTIGTYGDALYLYSEYVFGGRKGPNSLMALFEQGNNELQKQFRKAKADMDKNRDFKLTIMQKLRSMALMSNIFNPKYSYYYAVNNTDIGVNFYKNEEKTLTAKEKDARAKEAAELGENYGSIISKRAMFEKEGYENGEEQVQNFLYPELTTPSSQEISLGDVQVTFKDGKITDWNINPKVAQDTFKISGDNDSEIIENFNNSDKEEIKNTIVEIDNIVKMINDNIDMTYTGVYVDGTVVTEIRNLDIVQTALELAVLKGTGKC